MPKITVGQTLYYVPCRGSPREITITNVGRKWAYFGRRDERVNVETMVVFWGGYEGHCYLSAADYEAELSADKAWNALYSKIWPKNRRHGITAAAIREAAALLGVDIGEAGNG